MSKPKKGIRMKLENKEDVKEFFNFMSYPEVNYQHFDAMEKRDRTKIMMVTREEWGAAPPDETKFKIRTVDRPVRYITFSSTYTDTCKTKEECVKLVKKLQEEHIKKGIHDIMHNFLIADDGTVYEGRGWNKENVRQMEGHPLGQNNVNIAYIGKYKEPNNMPNNDMLDAAFNLIREGVEKGFIHKRYNISTLDFID